MSRFGDRTDATLMEAADQMLEQMIASTPARIAVGRAGVRPRTATWLQFRADHAMAKDAVHAELSCQFLNSFAKASCMPVVQSNALDRRDYILFPPKGKRTSLEALERLKSECSTGGDVQIIISDGLSAAAVEENVPELLAMLTDGFELEKISCGVPVLVKLGRVAIGDQIAHALGARLVINLIGERPGLSCATSLSAYMTFDPGPNTISSHRTVVSNIHRLGTPPVEAGAYIVKLAKLILAHKVSGVRLQQMS